MMPTWPFDPDSLDAQLAALPWDLGQQLFAPQALIVIVMLMVGVAVLAVMVASMSNDTSAPADAVRMFPEQQASDSATGWLGSTCAWLCPWQPRQPLAAG